MVSLLIWGSHFKKRKTILHMDNKGVLFAINCMSSIIDLVVRLLRFILLSCLDIFVLDARRPITVEVLLKLVVSS